MPFFTKKPVRIEAVQFLRIDPASGNALFAGDEDGAMWVTEFQSLHIRTLEGIMTVSPADWVICGVKGELYPCKPEIFAATYDQVPE
ncbi:hypothetical protein [Sphingopyxis sp. 113P3]|uniref:hypothetical protein n=1 Tax=Sphingopyxis sp. (strain 113P3) TaxID=292913 RepID=UPI0006AD2292|nr:hypothetical protein [Sphingopyxis sp. 113P3]ALC13803.1 hypothetical protein LH20_17740 [Sphingopyxis sp. 113P3]